MLYSLLPALAHHGYKCQRLRTNRVMRCGAIAMISLLSATQSFPALAQDELRADISDFIEACDSGVMRHEATFDGDVLLLKITMDATPLYTEISIPMPQIASVRYDGTIRFACAGIACISEVSIYPSPRAYLPTIRNERRRNSYIFSGCSIEENERLVPMFEQIIGPRGDDAEEGYDG